MISAEPTSRIPEFPVHWDDPADAELTWTTDLMHNPEPMCPLVQSLQYSLSDGFMAGMLEFGLPFKARHIRYQNYYQFERMEMEAPPSPEAAEAGGKQLEATIKQETARLGKRWETEHLPRVKQIISRHIAMEREVGTASLPGIAELLREYEAIRRELWTIHFRTVIPMLLSMQAYDEFYSDVLGGSDGDSHALLVGQSTRSVDAGIGLSDLAAAARASGLERLIIDTPADELLDTLQKSENGLSLLEKFNDYLESYGYRSDLFVDPPGHNPLIPDQWL